MVLRHARTGAKVFVLPESALGLLAPSVERFWTDVLAAHSITVVAGAAVIDPAGYDNVMVAIGSTGALFFWLLPSHVDGFCADVRAPLACLWCHSI
ncbi:hypothetical protein C7I85_03985 [Mesorhizobium soli]|uniref:CN hydrolase domain-containing protein n=1 Tax=Pseudaminobacter soli (ex Li et al. 2025) TaxID=1295366 RepID=A0A2P7SJT7_9HYPH|nr:hypothetical protein C7I85_03985 [Mesorhizobium soli]